MEINWPQLLQDYGPFALLPFTFLVLERTAVKRAHDHKLPEMTRNCVYAAAWVLIFLLCGAVVFFWYSDHVQQREAVMRGSIRGLSVGQRFRGAGPERANVRVFTYRDPQQTDQVFWRTFSAEPLDEQTELTFLIDKSTQSSEETWRFPFRASRKFYGASTDLRFRYDSASGKIIFENGPAGKPEELSGEPIVVASDTPPRGPRLPSLPWFGAVMAQTKRSAGTVVQNLDSDDPLIRLTARKQLALLGPEAMSTMDKAMANLDSSYRVKLGVIVAANEMKGFRPEAFSPRAWCEVWWAAQTGDETMKGQAEPLMNRRHRVDYHCGYVCDYKGGDENVEELAGQVALSRGAQNLPCPFSQSHWRLQP